MSEHPFDLWGGPAFPTQLKQGEEITTWRGLSIRDWFAGQALSGLLQEFSTLPENDLARYAYQQADAMLKAREETNDAD